MNPQLAVVIVEDERKAAATLRRLLEDYCADVRVQAVAHSVKEGVEAISNHQPDLVFLDIEMQTGTGFDLLDQLDDLHFEVVFTTAYEHYALKAVRVSAIDYLLKPIDWEELQAAVAKVQRKRQFRQEDPRLEQLLDRIRQPEKTGGSITLSTSEGYEFLQVEDIVRLEANRSYTTFFLVGGRKIMVSRHLKEYEQLLSEYRFMRVHQSHLINLNQVERMLRQDGGYVQMKDGALVDIAQKNREAFLKAMQ